MLLNNLLKLVQLLNLSKHFINRDLHMKVTKKKMAGDFLSPAFFRCRLASFVSH
jgi:hypothetical protein